MNCESGIFQVVRVVDVFVLGPIMVNAGKQIGGTTGFFLAASGVLTIAFNAANFLDIQGRK